MGILRARMERDLLVRGLSTNTHEAYLRAVVELTKYYDRSPDTLTPDEVQDYLVHLIEDRKLAWSSCSVAAHGLRFFYEVTLGWPRSRFYIPAPKRPAKQPSYVVEHCGRDRRNLRPPQYLMLPAPHDPYLDSGSRLPGDSFPAVSAGLLTGPMQASLAHPSPPRRDWIPSGSDSGRSAP